MAVLNQFFYDGQIERFIVQFIRLVSGFQVEFGKDRDGNVTLQRVPVYYGDSQKQVMSVLTNNSESTLPTVPAMAVLIKNISYDRDRVQDPTFIGKMHVRQRAYNDITQEYEEKQGNAFTIERLMPVPYTLELTLDIWTSNTKQKLQLIEQLAVLFNPAMEIQSTDNYVDWGSLSVVYLDSPNWTTRSVPVGTDNPIDVATLTFKMPIWISAPAKVKKLGVVQKIVSNVLNASGNLSDTVLNADTLGLNRAFYTPLNYGVLLLGNTLTLLKSNDFEFPREPTLNTPVKVGTKDIWRNLINVYGILKNGISQIRLMMDDGVTEIVGTVSYHPTDETLLIFNADVDTYPANTLDPIDAIIDPTKTTVDSSITSPATGTRYLILKAIGSYENPIGYGPIAWQGSDNIALVANANDIIEYTGSHWKVVFDSQYTDQVQYVSNLNTGTQYKWNLTQWIKSWEGEYKNGQWTLVL